MTFIYKWRKKCRFLADGKANTPKPLVSQMRLRPMIELYKNNGSFWSFLCVCPEPVLVK
jgi:hypothetical protein